MREKANDGKFVLAKIYINYNDTSARLNVILRSCSVGNGEVEIPMRKILISLVTILVINEGGKFNGKTQI